MKLEWLKEIIGEGYTEEIDKKAAEKLGEQFVSRADYNTLNETKKGLEGQIRSRDKDISDLKKAAGDNAELSKRYQELQNKYKTDTDNLNKAITENKKNNAVDMAILQAKGRNPKAIKALLDMDKITLKDDGTLEGLDLEGLKKSDSYLFDTEALKTVGTGAPKTGVQTGIDSDNFIAAARAAAGLK